MKDNVTSQDELMKKAKKMLLQNGSESLSIRKLAKECGISVGVFYNYFETKTDLIFAIVFDFWEKIITHENLENQDDICIYVESLYKLLIDKIDDFEKTLLMQISILNSTDKQKGRQLERQCFAEIMNEMMNVVERDKKISKDAFNNSLTKESFVHFIMMNTVSIARNRHGDCNAFIEIIKRILY